jgi:hypothetical protein
MMNSKEQRVTKIIDEILALHSRVERSIDVLKSKLDIVSRTVDESALYGSSDYWQLVAFKDGMIKVRLMIEQNFHFIETFGVLATTRYMLELLIWFRLLSNNPGNYCFIYVQQLINDKRDHAKEHLAKVKNEIKLFKELDTKEGLDVNQIASRPHKEFAEATRMVMSEIDRTARRQFCAPRRGTRRHLFSDKPIRGREH